MSATIEDYFRLAFEEKIAVKLPEKEDDSLTSATRLLEKRREMAEVEQALAAQKEEFQMKMESLQQRREELEHKERQLKESLLKFDKFLKENDSKRIRAKKKASVENEIRRGKEKEIEKLEEEYDALVKQRDRLLRKLEKSAVSQKYLDRVLETAEEFHEIREVIARYDTLTSTHADLLERNQEIQDRMDACKRELMLYNENKNNEILGYNNELASLQTRLDRAQGDAVKWESKWTHIQNTAARKTLQLGRIKMAVHNLYQVVRRHRIVPSTEEELDIEDTSEQLKHVMEYIEDLTQINQEIRRQDAQLTSVGDSSTTAAGD